MLHVTYIIYVYFGGDRSPAVACWASDDWVASSNPLRASFVINFASLSPA